MKDNRGVREEKLFKHLLNLWICDKKCVKNLYIKNLKCTGRKNSKSDFQLFFFSNCPKGFNIKRKQKCTSNILLMRSKNVLYIKVTWYLKTLFKSFENFQIFSLYSIQGVLCGSQALLKIGENEGRWSTVVSVLKVKRNTLLTFVNLILPA